MTKKKILLIDDETSITSLLRLNLEASGRFIVRAENQGAKGVETALAFRPDLILLDIMMPDMDGGDVAASIQSDPTMKATPIVFLTAAVRKEEVNRSDGVIGGFPYIAKPLSVRGVIAEIDRHLGKQA